MRALFSWGAAFVIVVLVALWLGSGTLVEGGHGPGNGEKPVISLFDPKAAHAAGSKAEQDQVNEPDPKLTIAEREAKTQGAAAPVRSVEVKTYTAVAMPIEVAVRGQTKAKATVTAAAETAGTVATVNVTKGQAVKAGDLLCTLDPETRQAAVAQAQAALAQAQAGLDKAQADYDTNKTLIAKGAATQNSARALETALVAAKANVAAAQAGLDNAKTELARTRIVAKVDGIVQDPIANQGSMLAAGGTCATIVELNPIIFSGAVPEARIAYAKIGLPASVTTVTGDTLQGKVTYVSAVSDPATRAFPAEIELPNPDNKVQAGLSATATVNVGTAPAQLLPQSVLTLNDDGTLGVRAVDNGKVVFYPVTIVKDAREGMYVTGLPLKVDVITVGQEFVKSGDMVKAVQDLGKSSVGPTAATEGAQS
ncbi:MAG TPA: efflux RND transporter periplasmic adaptor subunit [Devosiaceae bacterium]|jgi:multidrug efflux system membrane fusion protein|nr:efflux RND transporter periplasmic adaptor subunit [Devosiaceae bacterium]